MRHIFFSGKIFETVIDIQKDSLSIIQPMEKLELNKEEIIGFGFVNTSAPPVYPKEVMPIGIKQLMNYSEDLTMKGQQVIFAYKKGNRKKVRVFYIDRESDEREKLINDLKENLNEKVEWNEKGYFELRKQFRFNNLSSYAIGIILVLICFLLACIAFLALWYLQSLLPF